MVAPGGYRVEQILLQRDLRRPAVSYLRATRLGYWINDCPTVGEVANYIDLAEPRHRGRVTPAWPARSKLWKRVGGGSCHHGGLENHAVAALREAARPRM